MSMFLEVSMSSIPISATLMARSPILLARSQSRTSLNECRVCQGVGLCVGVHDKCSPMCGELMMS